MVLYFSPYNSNNSKPSHKRASKDEYTDNAHVIIMSACYFKLSFMATLYQAYTMVHTPLLVCFRSPWFPLVGQKVKTLIDSEG